MTVDTQALRAIAVRETASFVKWNVDPQTDRVLGAAAVGTHATELIAEARLPIRSEPTTREVARTIHAHLTFGEAWMEADHAFAGEYIHAPPREKQS